MPKEVFGAGHAFLRDPQLMTLGELGRIAGAFVTLGVEKIRLTGGEPLLRPDLPDFVRVLKQEHGLKEVAMTTNGWLLERAAPALREAGLDRLNVSVDALDAEVGGRMNGLGFKVERVLRGIDAAAALGFPIKINCVVQRGVNEREILPLAEYFRGRGHPLRFIEFMDVGNVNGWTPKLVVSGAEIRAILDAEFSLEPEAVRSGETAQLYRCRRTGARFGFIDSVTQPFCRDCNRLRLSADGRIFTCLFSHQGYDLRRPLRDGASDEELARHIAEIWHTREDRYSELRSKVHLEEPKVEMSYIGG